MKKIKNSLPFKLNEQLFRWGPVPVRFLYVSTFVETHYKHFCAKYGENWSETLWLFKNDRSLWVNNDSDIQTAGQRVFVKYMLPKKIRQKVYQEWLGCAGEISILEKMIDSVQLSKLSNRELLKLWKNFNSVYIKFWVVGSIPELANYGSAAFLQEQLKQYIPEQKISAVLEVLTAPTCSSFYQDEEIALIKTRDLSKHQQQFFWLKNSYAGTQVLPVGFFSKRKKDILLNIERIIQKKLIETLAHKTKIQKQYNLPPKIMAIAEAIADGVGWQDERKKHIFIILHYLDVLVKEVARRFEYDYDKLHNLWYCQITQIIQGKNLRPELLKRDKGFGVRFFHDCQEFSAKETEYFWSIYEAEKISSETVIKGITVSKGDGRVVRGKVHIILDPNKIEDFKKGEVLVAPMTSPEYVFVMKNACAVVTDTGGLTSHAAIVSRELNIPCIVGTKIATKVLKNGDLIEMDTNSGTVKIIKKVN